MNPRLNPDIFYVNGVPIPAAYFQGIDTYQFQSVNGDAGGTWTPSTQMAIGGAGLWVAAPSTIGGNASIVNRLGSGARITLGANDAIQLQTGHTSSVRTIMTSCGRAADSSCLLSPPVGYDPTTDGAIGKGAGCRFNVPLRVHNGGELVSATLYVNTAGGRAALPTQPRMRICAVDALGNVTPLKTTTPVAGGWQAFTVATVGAYNSHALSLVYTCDVGIFMNTAAYSYYAEIVDETGANAIPGNVYMGLLASFDKIPDLGAD